MGASALWKITGMEEKDADRRVNGMRIAPAPLFQDPVFEGPTDPTIIYNHMEKSWWILYTQRRANVPSHGYGWVHGTDIGVASSKDNGQTWLYRGTLNIESIEPGRNTFWAPEVIWADGCFHMYVSYITGVPVAWVGDRNILHYTSDNLWDWRYQGTLELSSHRVIDACVYPTAEGWRMWYKDEDDQSHTHYADSFDLFSWRHMGVATDDQSEEGPNVFKLGGKYWLIADIWKGIGVYYSDDLLRWKRQNGDILSTSGVRNDDACLGHHADVIVQGEIAYIFYHVHPDEQLISGDPYSNYPRCRSCIQVAQLTVENDRLTVIRDEPFDFYLPDDGA